MSIADHSSSMLEVKLMSERESERVGECVIVMGYHLASGAVNCYIFTKPNSMKKCECWNTEKQIVKMA